MPEEFEEPPHMLVGSDDTPPSAAFRRCEGGSEEGKSSRFKALVLHFASEFRVYVFFILLRRIRASARASAKVKARVT